MPTRPCLHPRTICALLPAHAHPRLPPPTHACLHLDNAWIPTLPTPAHPPAAPTWIPCLLLPTLPSHLEGAPVPCRGLSRPPGQGAGRDLASGCDAGVFPLLFVLAGGGSGGWRPWDREAEGVGPRRRLPDSSFITAAGPGHGGKARLDFKLENKPRILPSPAPALTVGQAPRLPPPPACPLRQMRKLRHGTPLCHGAVMLLRPRRTLPCPLPEPGTVLLLSWRAASIGAPWAAACRLIYLFVTAGSIDPRRGGLRPPQPD